MKKVLLVDDARAVRMACRHFVSGAGLEVLEAENGEEALRIVREHSHIDAILLDWHMPVMNGLSFLKTLRDEPLPKQPIVLMCSSENERSRIVEALQAGANEYIMKPFTEDIIRGKLAETGVL